MRSNQKKTDARRAGFTLVESLVALTIVSISLAALGALSASSFRTGLYVERHVADINAAQMIMTGLPARDALVDGSLKGELADHNWRLDIAPFTDAIVDPNLPTQWEPQRLALRVESANGAILRFDTIRLRKKPAP